MVVRIIVINAAILTHRENCWEIFDCFLAMVRG